MAYIQVNDDITIHYEMEGSGKPLIILHGLGNSSQSWKKQLDGLKNQFTVIAWDAPGYGKSSDQKEPYTSFSQFADILNAFIDKLGYDSVYLLGHSMGSAIALDFTYRFPEKVDSLVIADATRGAAGQSEEENLKKLHRRINNIKNLSPNEIAKQRVKELLAPNPQPEVKAEAERIMAQVRPMGYISVSNSLFSLNQMDILPSIIVPTLVICGELDKATPVSESEIFHDLIPNSRLVIIPNTGHLCYQEDSEGFNSEIIGFLVK
ncbi:alpha/beta fold hydrolase [Cytobacillus purgationiresistens]|uniref:Pimeloyl-ACP methyl ester carboxylesterase n=1 Tax=Cytobacillus purgationiresistens TaxID=863449 RepID=A0ABU0AEZ9_9BACI|nr:alpha/beta hydrolase [Cytobacillus purgationiresistens]MDQ0269837.1 pimeloyl-ACP methyl ester carboxylesterase [Cytobacillus purgationiresistens]